MSTIEREVFIKASPADVGATLATSPWSSAFAVSPEGAGTRVRIRASAAPPPVAAALEEAMLAVVCTAKRQFEDGADQADVTAGKSM